MTNTTKPALPDDLDELSHELWAAVVWMQAREALELIAAPMRPDGTWNRDREACRQLAAEALGRYDDDTQQWLPIETAPKTGRKVIVFYRNRNNLPRTVMARWLTDEQAAETDADDVGLEGGWYECIDNWDDYTEVAIHEGEPTHWMPLPAAPPRPAPAANGTASDP